MEGIKGEREMKELIEALGRIAAGLDKVKEIANKAIDSIAKEQFEQYVKDKVHKETENISTNNYDTSKNKERFPYHIDNIKKNTFYHGSNLDKTVKDYCIENRCWVARDKNGTICTYEKSERPECNYIDEIWTGHYYRGFLDQHSYAFPDVPWDKSLIAPDGRLILIEGKKEKKRKECKFKAGKWYRSKRNSSIIHCQEVIEKNIIKIDGLPKNGTAIFCVDDLSDWYEMKHYNPNKKKKPSELKRGEPVFVWPSDSDDNIPAEVKYFHSFYKYGIFTFSPENYKEKWTPYRCYRKYDPRLVGVPRKDWEDMPYA